MAPLLSPTHFLWTHWPASFSQNQVPQLLPVLWTAENLVCSEGRGQWFLNFLSQWSLPVFQLPILPREEHFLSLQALTFSPHPLPLLVQRNQKRFLQLTKIQVIFCTNIWEVSLEDVYLGLVNYRGNDNFRANFQFLHKDVDNPLWKRWSILPQCMLIISLTEILLFWSDYETITCNNNNSLKLITAGKESLALQSMALMPWVVQVRICLDWQEPFYKFEQLEIPVAAAVEIFWSQSWQRLQCRSPAAHSDILKHHLQFKTAKGILTPTS